MNMEILTVKTLKHLFIYEVHIKTCHEIDFYKINLNLQN